MVKRYEHGDPEPRFSPKTATVVALLVVVMVHIIGYAVITKVLSRPCDTDPASKTDMFFCPDPDAGLEKDGG